MSVQNLSQYMCKSRNSYLNIAFRLLIYLKSCPGKGISITRYDNFVLIGFVDLIGLNVCHQEDRLQDIWFRLGIPLYQERLRNVLLFLILPLNLNTRPLGPYI